MASRLSSDGGATGAISTLASTGQCPTDFSAAPTEAWSTDTLTADCAGQWTLCYTLKAGDPMNPQASDCTVIQECVTAHYPGGSTPVAFPPLPGWLAPSSAAACVAQFASTGGYGQMSINGQSDLCQFEDEQELGVQTYCPIRCTGSNPPPACATCMSGSF